MELTSGFKSINKARDIREIAGQITATFGFFDDRLNSVPLSHGEKYPETPPSSRRHI